MAGSGSSLAGTMYWTVTDREGTVADVLDSDGKLRVHNKFDSFGNAVSETHYSWNGSTVTSGPNYIDEAFAYTGRWFDKDTGLQNNLNRWYDASIGRWMSEDPIGFNGGDANLYRYVGNSPVNAADPRGLGEATFPFNSKVWNKGNCPIWVYPGSTGNGEWLGPGEHTSNWYDNGDFYMWDGRWYKVPGYGVGGVDSSGKPYLMCIWKGHWNAPLPFNRPLPTPPWMIPGVPPLQPPYVPPLPRSY